MKHPHDGPSWLSVLMVGKQGPAFGDRPSATTLTVIAEDGDVVESRVRNLADDDRAEALRIAFDLVQDEPDAEEFLDYNYEE